MHERIELLETLASGQNEHSRFTNSRNHPKYYHGIVNSQ